MVDTGFEKQAMPLYVMEMLAEEIVRVCGHGHVCGSIRRKKPTARDIDIVIEPEHRESFIEEFTALLDDDDIVRTKKDGSVVGGRYKGVPVELYFSEPGALCFATMYATGSANWNVLMRVIAKRKGLKLSDKGLFNRETDEKVSNAQTEEEICRDLGIPYRKPEDREIDDVWKEVNKIVKRPE